MILCYGYENHECSLCHMRHIGHWGEMTEEKMLEALRLGMEVRMTDSAPLDGWSAPIAVKIEPRLLPWAELTMEVCSPDTDAAGTVQFAKMLLEAVKRVHQEFEAQNTPPAP